MASGESYTPGVLIEHATKPEWGPGKVCRIDGDKLYVIFRDVEGRASKTFKAGFHTIRLATIQSDPVLDHLPPLVEKNAIWQLPFDRVSLATAIRLFERAFPLSFLEPEYVAVERKYKMDAHDRFKEYFGEGRGERLIAEGHFASVVSQARSILSPMNLIYPMEAAAFNDAMKDIAAAKSFYSALFTLVASPVLDRTTFLQYSEVVLALPAPRGMVASWPVATVFLLIADPARFMFLKPTATREAARMLAFDLRYEVKPNWDTYTLLLKMGEIYLNKLKHLGAQDFIDVQTFFFVVGGGYDAEIQAKATANVPPAPAVMDGGLRSNSAPQTANMLQRVLLDESVP